MPKVRTTLAVAVAALAGSALVGSASPACAAPEPISVGESITVVIDGALHSISLGTHEIEGGDPMGSTQRGDARVREFRTSRGDTPAHFSAGQVLDITVPAAPGQYLGAPSVFPVRSGLVFCRANPAATETGTRWSVDTASY